MRSAQEIAQAASSYREAMALTERQYRMTQKAVEKAYIQRMLRANREAISATARQMGVGVKTLKALMAKHGIVTRQERREVSATNQKLAAWR